MLAMSRLTRVVVVLSMVAVGCGGGSGNQSNPGPDAAGNPDSSLTDDGGTSNGGDSAAGDDGAMGTGDDGSVDSGTDGSMTTGADGSVDPGTDAGTVDSGTTDSGTTDSGTTDAGNTGTDAGAANGATCTTNGGCQNGHCVGGTCCASACNTPPACQTATGATCGGGTTCVYANLADKTSCNDGDVCTTTDVCTGGKCAGTAVDCSAVGDLCNVGVCNPSSGACMKQASNEAGPCNDGNACTTGEICTAGVCGGGAATNCNDSNPCTTDTCDVMLGCKNTNNTASCNDGNPCTVSDTCAAGLCKGTAMDCSAKNDACNVGVCTAGTCGKSPKADNTACNDGLACTATDVCKSGVCTGSGDSCGANATACSEGPPKTCTCAATYTSSGGQCVPDTNECDAAPCVATATCNDPSSAPNNVVCTCPAGYTGDGKKTGTGCTLVNNCAGSPCGAGTCVNGVNTYTCSCNQGYVSVDGACSCDMNGTFAVQISLTTSWSNINLFEDGTNVASTTWALRTQTYDSSGNLVIETTPCGGTTFDLCGENDPIGDEAYAQYLPGPIYGTASMPVGNLSISVPKALPGQGYTEPQTATLLGISLTDPLGTWPAANTNIGAGTNQTNGAIWVDNDSDGFEGVTSYAVPPGGISHTTAPFPLQDYGATSTACPRRSAALARLSYDYLPGIQGLTLVRVKRVYTASRFISSMTGKITTCDTTGATLIQGTLGGPDSGEPHADARVGGCVEVAGTGDAGTAEADCTAMVASEYDGQNQSESITSGSFIIKRVAKTATCADVRATTF